MAKTITPRMTDVKMIANEFASRWSIKITDMDGNPVINNWQWEMAKELEMILTQTKEEWCRKQRNALKSALQMLEQTLAYRKANNIIGGNIFLERTINEIKEALNT